MRTSERITAIASGLLLLSILAGCGRTRTSDEILDAMAAWEQENPTGRSDVIARMRADLEWAEGSGFYPYWLTIAEPLAVENELTDSKGVRIRFSVVTVNVDQMTATKSDSWLLEIGGQVHASVSVEVNMDENELSESRGEYLDLKVDFSLDDANQFLGADDVKLSLVDGSRRVWSIPTSGMGDNYFRIRDQAIKDGQRVCLVDFGRGRFPYSPVFVQ